MADEIRADYDQLEQVAQRFNQQSQAVQQMLQQVNNSMEKIHESWEGKGSSAFFNEMRSKVLPASKRLKDALLEASHTTTNIAHTVREAEEEAGALFHAS